MTGTNTPNPKILDHTPPPLTTRLCGYTDPLKFVDGNPYGASHVTGANNDEPLGDADIDALRHLASRVVTVSERLAS